MASINEKYRQYLANKLDYRVGFMDSSENNTTLEDIMNLDSKHTFSIISSRDLTINSAELGKGGFATVRQGFWREKMVAIKKIRPTSNPEVDWKKFENEYEIQRRLSHPQIVTLFAVCTEANSYCLVQEYMDGGTLRSVLSNINYRRTSAALWLMAYDVASALDHIHQHGIAHNDVKPENILLTNHRAKLTDFGFATPINLPSRAGTVQYLAPECFLVPSGRDEKADVYALGLVIWELFFGDGKIPFSGWDKHDLKLHIARDNGKEIIPSGASPTTVEIINGCWRKKEERFSAAKLMLDIQKNLDNNINASESLQTTNISISS